MSQKIDIQELKTKLYAKLGPFGWANKLKSFILSNEFDTILEKLVADSEEGKRFVPTLKHVFSAFEDCSYEDTRVVFIGQDPYPYIGVPDGKAFSCSLKGKAEVSLEYIFREISETVYGGIYNEDPDLTRWSKQGILLLNSALTVTVRHPNSHYLLWRPFIGCVLDSLVWNPDKFDTIFVFIGSKAQEYMDLVPDNFNKLKVSHPASAAYNKLERWNSQDLFNQINTILEKQGKEKIVW